MSGKLSRTVLRRREGSNPFSLVDYTGNTFKNKIEEFGMIQSMSRVGKCIDNGPMEGFFGTLKTEMFYGKKFKTLEELKEKIVKYIEFYNEKRFQKRLGCMAPLEYRTLAS